MSLRSILFASLSVAASLVITLVALEAGLRIVYRDGGTRTSGGPGGQPFEHLFSGDDYRGPLPIADGPRRPGVTRIMVQGDSITYGHGVRDWRDLYPNLLLEKLNGTGQYEMVVFANPGKEIDNHLFTLSNVAEQISPDIVIYQWYVNDVEISKEGRPHARSFWRLWPWHDTTARYSYLYFLLDWQMDRLASFTGQSYEDYLINEFGEGTAGWDAFAGTFFGWATLTTAYASRVIVVEYPALDGKGRDPLQAIRQAVTRLARRRQLTFAATTMAQTIGTNVQEPGSAPDSFRRASAGSAPGYLVSGGQVPLHHGAYVASFKMRASGPVSGPIATVDVVHGQDHIELARRELSAADVSPSGTWVTVTLPFEVADRMVHRVEFRVRFLGGTTIDVERVELPLDYHLEVVDLTPHLQGFDTSASMFDRHPNERAHAVIADVLFDRITHPRAE